VTDRWTDAQSQRQKITDSLPWRGDQKSTHRAPTSPKHPQQQCSVEFLTISAAVANHWLDVNKPMNQQHDGSQYLLEEVIKWEKVDGLV